MNLTDIEQQIKSLQEQKQRLLELETRPEHVKLGELMHRCMCNASHEDQCDFFYDNSYARNAWETRATDLLRDVAYQDAVKVLNFIYGE